MVNFISAVVGYDSVGLLDNGGAKGVGLSFDRVDGKQITFKDMVITGYNKEDGYGDWGISCQKLDAFGMTLGIDYFWCDYEEEVEDGVFEKYYGWYDGDMNCYNDAELVEGEGVWMFSPDTKFSIQSSGQVPTERVTVGLLENGGAKMVINPMPVEMKFGEFFVEGYEKEEGYGDWGISCQKLDAFGMTLGIDYFWCDYEEEVEDGVFDTYYGWYDGDMNCYNENTTLKPGEGIWVFSPDTKYSIVFPAPEL